MNLQVGDLIVRTRPGDSFINMWMITAVQTLNALGYQEAMISSNTNTQISTDYWYACRDVYNKKMDKLYRNGKLI